MKRFIDVHRGEVMVGKGEVVLKSDANRACLVIAAYDAAQKIGALAHAMFKSKEAERRIHANVLRDSKEAIDEMINDMLMLGSHIDDIEVSLVTGENMNGSKSSPDYERSISETIEMLQKRHVRLRPNIKEDVGDMHVSLDVESGQLSFI